MEYSNVKRSCNLNIYEELNYRKKQRVENEYNCHGILISPINPKKRGQSLREVLTYLKVNYSEDKNNVKKENIQKKNVKEGNVENEEMTYNVEKAIKKEIKESNIQHNQFVPMKSMNKTLVFIIIKEVKHNLLPSDIVSKLFIDASENNLNWNFRYTCKLIPVDYICKPDITEFINTILPLLKKHFPKGLSVEKNLSSNDIIKSLNIPIISNNKNEINKVNKENKKNEKNKEKEKENEEKENEEKENEEKENEEKENEETEEYEEKENEENEETEEKENEETEEYEEKEKEENEETEEKENEETEKYEEKENEETEEYEEKENEETEEYEEKENKEKENKKKEKKEKENEENKIKIDDQKKLSWALIYKRNKTNKLNKNIVLNILDSSIGSNYSVNLSNPDIAIVITVDEIMCGISIMKNYGKTRKFNIAAFSNNN